MKKAIYTFISVIGITGAAMAQNPIPNPSFETWTNANYPDGSPYSSNISKSTTAHSGQYAVKGEYQTGNPDLSIGGGNGFNTSIRWAYLNFYYIFNKASSSDAITVSVLFDDANTTTIGAGSLLITTAASGYTSVSVPVQFFQSGNPVSCTIDIGLTNSSTGTATAGAYFIIDDISLSQSSLAVQEVERESSSIHVFPNPAKNTVQLRLDETVADAYLQITDMLGRVVKEMPLSADFVSIDISNLPSGNYILTIRNNEAVQTKRLTVE